MVLLSGSTSYTSYPTTSTTSYPTSTFTGTSPYLGSGTSYSYFAPQPTAQPVYQDPYASITPSLLSILSQPAPTYSGGGDAYAYNQPTYNVSVNQSQVNQGARTPLSLQHPNQPGFAPMPQMELPKGILGRYAPNMVMAQADMPQGAYQQQQQQNPGPAMPTGFYQQQQQSFANENRNYARNRQSDAYAAADGAANTINQFDPGAYYDKQRAGLDPVFGMMQSGNRGKAALGALLSIGRNMDRGRAQSNYANTARNSTLARGVQLNQSANMQMDQARLMKDLADSARGHAAGAINSLGSNEAQWYRGNEISQSEKQRMIEDFKKHIPPPPGTPERQAHDAYGDRLAKQLGVDRGYLFNNIEQETMQTRRVHQNTFDERTMDARVAGANATADIKKNKAEIQKKYGELIASIDLKNKVSRGVIMSWAAKAAQTNAETLPALKALTMQMMQSTLGEKEKRAIYGLYNFKRSTFNAARSAQETMNFMDPTDPGYAELQSGLASLSSDEDELMSALANIQSQPAATPGKQAGNPKTNAMVSPPKVPTQDLIDGFKANYTKITKATGDPAAKNADIKKLRDMIGKDDPTALSEIDKFLSGIGLRATAGTYAKPR